MSEAGSSRAGDDPQERHWGVLQAAKNAFYKRCSCSLIAAVGRSPDNMSGLGLQDLSCFPVLSVCAGAQRDRRALAEMPRCSPMFLSTGRKPVLSVQVHLHAPGFDPQTIDQNLTMKCAWMQEQARHVSADATVQVTSIQHVNPTSASGVLTQLYSCSSQWTWNRCPQA